MRYESTGEKGRCTLGEKREEEEGSARETQVAAVICCAGMTMRTFVAALVLLRLLNLVHRLDENENIEKESAVIFHLHLQSCTLPAKEALMEA